MQANHKPAPVSRHLLKSFDRDIQKRGTMARKPSTLNISGVLSFVAGDETPAPPPVITSCDGIISYFFNVIRMIAHGIEIKIIVAI